MISHRVAACIHATLAAVLFATGAARADGTAHIQQSDGSLRVYHHVRIVLTRWTLWIRTADRHGVLEIESAGCSFEGELQRCLPFRMTLHQGGHSHPIALEHGTIYMNFTDSAHPLPIIDRLGPNEVLVLLRTIRGTYVSARGTLDDVS